MVKVKRSFPVSGSLVEEEKKAIGRYDKPDVIKRLKEDFHNKCYICEMKDLQDPNVEHLLLYKNGKYPERKYDWENLFWSCSHCNGVKNNGKYGEGIIDYCKQVPEECLSFKLKNTGMRTYTSDKRLKLLQKGMNLLYR